MSFAASASKESALKERMGLHALKYKLGFWNTMKQRAFKSSIKHRSCSGTDIVKQILESVLKDNTSSVALWQP